MELDLNPLESKITQVVALCRELRAENDALRNALAEAAHERDRLSEKLDAARTRLAALLEKLPEH